MSSDTKAQTAGGERSLPPIRIAILGTTGAGKSSFINIASGSDLVVGNKLESCTSEVAVSNEFTVDGRQVFLIDTPGFDDTTKSDTEILKRIAAYLEVTYAKGSKLAGILYVHRISDIRFTGASTRNLRMFKQLCGDSAMKNVILVTNMWGMGNKEVEEERENELFGTHFKPALDKGAQTARHSNTAQSAHDIIRRIVKNDPTPLLIQKELVDEGKSIENTSAGETVNEELNKALARHKADVEALQEEMRQAIAEKDEEMAREMKEEAEKVKKQMEEVRQAGANMATKYEKERKAVEKRMEEMAAKRDEERKAAEKEREDERKAADKRAGDMMKAMASRPVERAATPATPTPQVVYVQAKQQDQPPPKNRTIVGGLIRKGVNMFEDVAESVLK